MKPEFIWINKIMKNPSLCDGPGYRTVLFLQGCNRFCPGCHNPSSWNMKDGERIEIKELANILKTKGINKKITISGGEPLMQKEALIELLNHLEGYDICLYTSYELEEVPEEILSKLTYIKTGRYIQELRDVSLTYYGSTNQKLIDLRGFKNEK